MKASYHSVLHDAHSCHLCAYSRQSPCDLNGLHPLQELSNNQDHNKLYATVDHIVVRFAYSRLGSLLELICRVMRVAAFGQ